MSSTQRDYYEILGIAKSASLEQIRSAYREAALRYHPDRVPEAEKKGAEEKFKEISEAYAVLSDPKKRALYDQHGHSGIDQRYAYEDIFKGADFTTIFEDLSEFGFGETLFEKIFGDFGLSGKRRRNRDLQMALEITLEEAATGCEKKIALPRYDPCPECGGQGCQKCHGEGRVRITRQISVKIPAGIETGSQLRVRGEGEGGQGDLYIVIEVAPHPFFERQGDDLFAQVMIPLAAAVLGGEVTVPTLFGNVVMKIPAGTQNGAKFRLNGKGMPKIHQSERGDEYIIIAVEIPTHLTPEQKQLMEAFAKASKKAA